MFVEHLCKNIWHSSLCAAPRRALLDTKTQRVVRVIFHHPLFQLPWKPISNGLDGVIIGGGAGAFGGTMLALTLKDDNEIVNEVLIKTPAFTGGMVGGSAGTFYGILSVLIKIARR